MRRALSRTAPSAMKPITEGLSITRNSRTIVTTHNRDVSANRSYLNDGRAATVNGARRVSRGGSAQKTSLQLIAMFRIRAR